MFPIRFLVLAQPGYPDKEQLNGSCKEQTNLAVGIFILNRHVSVSDQAAFIS